jgi:hypothetical protein
MERGLQKCWCPRKKYQLIPCAAFWVTNNPRGVPSYEGTIPGTKDHSCFVPASHSRAQEFQDAGNFLNALPEFQRFLQSIRTNSAVTPHSNLGIFTVPRMNQLSIQPAVPAAYVLAHTTNIPVSRNLRSSAAAGAATSRREQPIIDEEVVNVCLITFLQALTGAVPNISSEWTPQRFAFRTQFAVDMYEARTDGYLQVQDASNKIQAIIEVKRRSRELRPDVEMQEAAEMVGWILDNDHRPDPALVGR